jgi:hypothetical protein
MESRNHFVAYHNSDKFGPFYGSGKKRSARRGEDGIAGPSAEATAAAVNPSDYSFATATFYVKLPIVAAEVKGGRKGGGKSGGPK